MMKKFLFITFIAVLMLTSCSEKDKRDQPLEKGMKYDEVLSSNAESFKFLNYLFFQNNEGNNVVCRFSEDMYLLEEVMEFSPAEPTKEAFSAISEGMTVADVVKTVGLPFRSVTFGLSTLDFNCLDGTVYRINWDIDAKVIEIYKI